MSGELKPCPFCGGAELQTKFEDIDGWIAYIRCVACDILGPVSAFKYPDKPDAEDDAGKMWNARAEVAGLKAQLDEAAKERMRLILATQAERDAGIERARGALDEVAVLRERAEKAEAEVERLGRERSALVRAVNAGYVAIGVFENQCTDEAGMYRAPGFGAFVAAHDFTEAFKAARLIVSPHNATDEERLSAGLAPAADAPRRERSEPMSDIGRIEIEIAETDDPSTRAVKVTVADGRCGWTKRYTIPVDETDDAVDVVAYATNQLIYGHCVFLTDPAAHADPIEPVRDAEWGCPLSPAAEGPR